LDESFEITQVDQGFIEISLAQFSYPIRIICTPFANEVRLKQFLGFEDKASQLHEVLANRWKQLADQYCNPQGVNVLTAHLYMLKRGGELLEEPEGEKPIRVGYADLVYSDSIPDTIQYTALGHLHRFHNIADNSAPVVYPSSPLCYSFSEAGQQKQVVIVDLEPHAAASYRAIPLQAGRPLFRKRFQHIDDAVLWLQQHPNALIELTLESESFLTAVDMKRLHGAHDGIIHVIPVVKKEEAQKIGVSQINLDQDIKGLFSDYFKSRYGQIPNEELLNLFDEVSSQTIEKED